MLNFLSRFFLNFTSILASSARRTYPQTVDNLCENQRRTSALSRTRCAIQKIRKFYADIMPRAIHFVYPSLYSTTDQKSKLNKAWRHFHTDSRLSQNGNEKDGILSDFIVRKMHEILSLYIRSNYNFTRITKRILNMKHKRKKCFGIKIFTRKPIILLSVNLFTVLLLFTCELYLIKFYNFDRIHIFVLQKNVDQMAMCVKRKSIFK